MLQKLRETTALVLLSLLPFHALLVTVGTKVILGPGHAPLSALALWKEALLGVILVVAAVEIILSLRGVLRIAYSVLKIDILDVLILVLGSIACLLQLWGAPRPLGEFLLGARYDFVPLVAFLLLRRVEWSAWFRAVLVRILLAVGTIVALLGIASLFLPVHVFTFLGYADLHSLYDPAGPLAPFHQIGESWVRRVQGTMSGPNQLGIWLLLPMGVCLSLLSFVRATKESSKEKRSAAEFPPVARWMLPLRPIVRLIGFLLPRNARRPFTPPAAAVSPRVLFIVLFLLGAALFLTFSRAAWIAAFVMILIVMGQVLPKKLFKRAFLGIVGILGILGITVTLLFPSVFFRLSSSRGHITRPLQAIGVMAAHPLGHGLGSAGPATNRNREPCVFLRPQDDPSWAKSQPQLCVFLGSQQVQPLDHQCNCPFLPENWYLQVGVELGVAGFVLFLVLTVMVLRRLWTTMRWDASGSDATCRVLTMFLFFLGVSIAALFLHAWEDAAVAYSGWVLAAVALGVSGTGKTHR